MPIQYQEFYHGKTGLTVGIRRILFSRQSDYQRVEVFETDTWGNLLTIDGMVMLSEKDEFVYHEMLSHPALFVHPAPRRVLIIGGGDGGTAREVMKHPTVEQVDLVEIDKVVIDASREYLPQVGDFENPKLRVLCEDGIAFVKNVTDPYDVIIVDGSDPVGPAEGLFSRSFYEDCRKALVDNGVLAAQTESPWVESYHKGVRDTWQTLKGLFRHTEMYLSYIPLYPGGMWSMMIASKGDGPLDESVLKRVKEGGARLEGLRYYNSAVHQGAFALPGFVREILGE